MTTQLANSFSIVMLDSLNDKNGTPIHEVNQKLTEKDISPQVAANYIRAGVAEIKGKMPQQLADLINPSVEDENENPDSDPNNPEKTDSSTERDSTEDNNKPEE
ncbi:hypothetical protein [Catenovulum sediminis]|uniref:Uncharacterized protein n=1 Tax=Catenovulum sediminis TaxID=1740262 RepID=A0ABV1RKA6_9ALTE